MTFKSDSRVCQTRWILHFELLETHFVYYRNYCTGYITYWELIHASYHNLIYQLNRTFWIVNIFSNLVAKVTKYNHIKWTKMILVQFLDEAILKFDFNTGLTKSFSSKIKYFWSRYFKWTLSRIMRHMCIRLVLVIINEIIRLFSVFLI